MALIVETGAGLTNAESYLSVADCDTYIEKHGGSSDWLGAKASTILTLTAQPADSKIVTIDGKVYTFQTVLTNVDGHVQIGADLAASIHNLYDAINLIGTAGTQYAASTTIHPAVTCTGMANRNIFMTTKLYGTFGNTLATTTDVAGASFTAATMAGGVNPTKSEMQKEDSLRLATQYLDAKYAVRWQGSRTNDTQALAWPRAYVYDYDNVEIDDATIPQALKDATAEMAKRSAELTTDLLPDLETPGTIRSTSVSVGPISESIQYMGGNSPLTTYSIVERLLTNLINPAGRLMRS